ncbi:MAG: primosomal protein N', partial [Chloroflexi bacterium]|nr:primosomal protein N' [Chloroflexota bacterium]
REPLSLTEANAHFSPSTVKTLLVKGLIKITELTEFRDPLLNYHFKETIPPVLTNGQELVWHKIQHALTNPVDKANVYLLHGVTGSGKTEIYIRALQKVVTGGKKGIVLVPEIALTPQTINRFASRFPGKVAVLHSKLSLGERYDEWQLIKEGMFDVVIGSRGAIYAPQPNLGLIIIDEEHEWTYKQQDQSPHYHARDVAIKLAGLTGATVILGSATPDVTTYFHCKNGEYELLQLPERIARENRKGLPEVELVDMRKELKAGNRSIFSNSLSQSISRALFAGEQIILFLNRRGSASFVQCRDCGFVIQCRRCKVSLTYHSAEGDMICHQCNYRIKPAATCPNCLSRRIKYFGIGTQRVAEEAGNTFSGARILRWDRDVTQGKHSHEKILNQFLNHEADILVGTQMIAKGLDLPLVTVVGIISADTALNIPDFRAGERTFQLITQVAGRAGRDLKAGKVIIQTYSPEHYAIDAAARYDYATFYKKELIYRRENNNPPYQRMARLLYSHTNEDHCRQESQ